MTELAAKRCTPCRGGVAPMSRERAEAMMEQIPDWELIAEEPLRVRRTFKLSDFRAAIDFVNEIAAAAEAEGHHPDLEIHYNAVVVSFHTHKIGGLHENDFIMAAKVDALFGGQQT